MAMLADSQLPALRSLHLSHNPITEEGLDVLLSAPQKGWSATPCAGGRRESGSRSSAATVTVTG